MTELQLQEAIQHQVLYGGRLGTNLLELGYITEPRLQEALSRALVVNLVYGDAGPAGNVKADMGELLVLLQKVPKAYERIIRRRIAEARQITGPPEGPPEENE